MEESGEKKGSGRKMKMGGESEAILASYKSRCLERNVLRQRTMGSMRERSRSCCQGRRRRSREDGSFPTGTKYYNYIFI